MSDTMQEITSKGYYALKGLERFPVKAFTAFKSGVAEDEIPEMKVGEVFTAMNGVHYIKVSESNELRRWFFTTPV